MSFKLVNILNEQNLSGRKSKPLVDAIKNRNPVTFYYSGPRTPEKDSVKSGVRIRAEVVAMGLSKKGNLIVRAYVQPPSVSKKGYNKTNWRTFIVDRMSNINVIENENFDNKRPGYKEGIESKNGPMVTTYVTSDWTKTPEIKTPEEKPKEVVPQDIPKPEPQITDKELPQPKTDNKPEPQPEIEKNFAEDIFKELSKNVSDVNGEKIITTQDYESSVRNLYKMKENEWVDRQKDLGSNIRPGSGTRKRFDIEANNELSNLLKNNNITVVNELPNNETEGLQESISRIKTLMLLIN
jgi:hypothetical protein